MTLTPFFASPPYGLPQREKERLLAGELAGLTEYHAARCPEYARYLRGIGYDPREARRVEDIPFFPARMFKELDLLSVPRESVVKTVTSSGTTGQAVSRIYLDRETAAAQQKAAARQLTDFWGHKRLPFLIVDSEETVKNRVRFSARASAIMGLRFFSKDTRFLLDADMNLRPDVLEEFLALHGGGRFVVFGFTFMVWRHLYKALLDAGRRVDMSRAILMTGGGWKKMESEGVTRSGFKSALREVCGITEFLDHYGMSEQVGSIYLECRCGHYHASVFSDVITRRPEDFSVCGVGEPGIIQVVSVVPRSYPGHSLLTEDEGVVEGVDDCPCGRLGKYIKVRGRIKTAELRGCSDTYAARF